MVRNIAMKFNFAVFIGYSQEIHCIVIKMWFIMSAPSLTFFKVTFCIGYVYTFKTVLEKSIKPVSHIACSEPVVKWLNDHNDISYKKTCWAKPEKAADILRYHHWFAGEVFTTQFCVLLLIGCVIIRKICFNQS